MGQAMSDARIALVVEDDPAVRDLATAVGIVLPGVELSA